MIRGVALAIPALLILLPACNEEPPSGLEGAVGPIALQESGKRLDPAICAPGQAGFTLGSHPYFPMEVGSQWFYAGEEVGSLSNCRSRFSMRPG